MGGCCASKPSRDNDDDDRDQRKRDDEMFSARDASLRIENNNNDDVDAVESRPKAKKQSKRKDAEKRLTVRLYADALAEKEQQSAIFEQEENRRKSVKLEAMANAAFLASPEAKAAKSAADSAAQLAQSERERKETWNVLDSLISEETHKRHSLLVRERSEYRHASNNDVDLPLAVDALCVMSLCLQRDPIPFDTLQTAHKQLAKELRKLCDDVKRRYFEPAVTRARFGNAAAQHGKSDLADAARTAFDRTERLRERIGKCEQQAAAQLSDAAQREMSEPEVRSSKLQVRQPLLQAVQLHWDDMRILIDGINPRAPLVRLTQLRDTLQDLLGAALTEALSVVRETSEPCEPADVERVSDSVTRALYNVIGFAALMSRNALGIGELTRLRGMADNLWLLVKGARLLALLSIDLATGTDDGIEQQRMARSLKQLVQGMTRRLDTILDAAAGDGEDMEYYTINKELTDYCEQALHETVTELEQANELLATQTTTAANEPLFTAVATLAHRVGKYDALLVSVAPADLVKHTRRVGGEFDLVASRLVMVAVRCGSAFPLYKDALLDTLQAAAHHCTQLRVLGGARALDYNVSIYHGALVLLCRQLCGALAAALQVCSALVSIGASDALAARPEDQAELPGVFAFVVQYVGAELGKRKEAADSVSTAVRSNLNVDALVLDVARNAAAEEVRKLEEERRTAAAARREQELQQSQALLLADLDETAADVAAEIDDVGPEPPKPIGFDDNQHYSEEVHGDYREWAKQKYNYTEWLRKKNLRDGNKKQLASAQQRLSTTMLPKKIKPIIADSDEAPPAPPPVQNLSASAASTVKRATLRSEAESQVNVGGGRSAKARTAEAGRNHC
jgi:hypothetical protein